MLENQHLNQEKLLGTSEVMHQQEHIQETLVGAKSEKQHMTIREVVELLNNNESIESVSQKLNMRANALETKLANAAVKLSENGQWEYRGENQKESLSRNIYSKIYVKAYDKEAVKTFAIVDSDIDEVVTDLDYELYKISRTIKDPADKKSILFEYGLYDDLKRLSKQKSIKVSILINALIKTGLDYYQLK